MSRALVVVCVLAFLSVANAALCTDYCTLMATACAGTAPAGDVFPFQSSAGCLAVCATWLNDDVAYNYTVIGGSNSLQCRLYHAEVASTTLPTTHCAHAAGGGGGVCGSTCDAYCNVYMSTTATTLLTTAPFSTLAQCITYCEFATYSTMANPAVTTGDTAECRTYHGQVGLEVGSAAHLGHGLPAPTDYFCTDVTTSSYSAAVEAYCTRIIDSCALSGSDATYGQFSSRAQCLEVAATWSRATLVNDQSTNSLDCRHYHAGVSGLVATHDGHCPHSGANGNGVCGTTCESYCQLITAACTGTDAQYTTEAECLLWCATLDTTGEVAPLATATADVQCRIYHAQVAISAATTALTTAHCAHAGPTGGDVCGTECEALCQGITATCLTTNAQFTDVAQCEAACAFWPTTGTFDDTAGNTIQCRQYHAEVASGSAILATAHCAHTGVTPAGVCGTNCESYCTLIGSAAVVGACTGADVQYATYDSCLEICEAFDAGTSSDTDVNTLGCRVYHATVAAAAATSALTTAHCTHAGASGGSVCGTVCAGFCAVAQHLCNDTNEIYSSDTVCQDACAAFPLTGSATSGVGDSYQCRAYHLAAASTSDADKAIHCPHAAASASLYCYDVTAAATCSLITGSCTGTNAVFDSDTACMEQLDSLTVGTAADISGATLGCRRYHAGVANTSAALATAHCAHTGMTPGGVCGSNCEAFCALHAYACGTGTDTTESYSSYATCVTECADFAVGTDGDMTGDTLACRLYHATVAVQSTTLAATHCAHAVYEPASQCVDGVTGAASSTTASALVVAALAVAVIAL